MTSTLTNGAVRILSKQRRTILLGHVGDGLSRLQRMATPPISLPPVWPEIVADALRLAREGWAIEAMKEGWRPLDLWGCSPLIGGNEDQCGLAVWLAGRPILRLKERVCVVRDGVASYAVFQRRRYMAGAVLLWELGGGSDGRGRGFGR